MKNDQRLALPPLRPKPRLVSDWQHLWHNELVELRCNGTVLGRGHIDLITDDVSTLWVYLEAGNGRVMVHESDGIDLWRIDPRICQERPARR